MGGWNQQERAQGVIRHIFSGHILDISVSLPQAPRRRLWSAEPKSRLSVRHMGKLRSRGSTGLNLFIQESKAELNGGGLPEQYGGGGSVNRRYLVCCDLHLALPQVLILGAHFQPP